MLKLEIAPPRSFNNETNQFEFGEGATLRLEHSLVSLSKWEAQYMKPFISDETKTPEETYDYIRAMNLDEDMVISDDLLKSMSSDTMSSINKYIESKMTATFFSDDNVKKVGRQPIITAEIIYYWLIALNMPVDIMQHWHVNRLIAQIKVVNKKQEEAQSGGKKKGFTKEDLANRKALIDKRRAEAAARG